MLDLARCHQLILQGLKLDALDPAFSALDIAIHAGDALANAHSWSFMQRKGTLDTVAGQEYVDLSLLPGFRALFRASYLNGWMEPIGYDAIQTYRSNGGSGISSDPGAYALVPNTASDGTVSYRLELFGTPSTSVTGGISVWYQGGFQRPENGASSSRIAVPEWCEGLFILFLRAVAFGYVEFDIAAMETRLESIRKSRVFLDAMSLDSRMQTNFGTVRGGAVAMQMATYPGIRMPSSVPSP